MNKLSIAEFEKLRQEGAVVLDLRPGNVFAESMIPGSYNIEFTENFTDIADKFVFRDQLMVLVCVEGKEVEYYYALEEMGYSNIAGYLDSGIKTWLENGKEVDVVVSIDSEELELEMRFGNPNLCDIRNAKEFGKSHIRDAENIDPELLANHNDLLDKSLLFYMYCEDGRASMLLISYLKTHGIQNIYHLKGGFNEVSKYPGIALTSGK